MQHRTLKNSFSLKRNNSDVNYLWHKLNLDSIRRNQTGITEDTLHFCQRAKQRKISQEETEKLRLEGELEEIQVSSSTETANPLPIYKLFVEKDGAKIVGVYMVDGIKLIGKTCWVE